MKCAEERKIYDEFNLNAAHIISCHHRPVWAVQQQKFASQSSSVYTLHHNFSTNVPPHCCRRLDFSIAATVRKLSARDMFIRCSSSQRASRSPATASSVTPQVEDTLVKWHHCHLSVPSASLFAPGPPPFPPLRHLLSCTQSGHNEPSPCNEL